jgi:hypothetical protein
MQLKRSWCGDVVARDADDGKRKRGGNKRRLAPHILDDSALTLEDKQCRLVSYADYRHKNEDIETLA